MRCLKEKGYSNIVTRTHKELDLLNQASVNEFFAAEKPEYVFLAAAHVGGIGANSTYPADFIYQNMAIIAEFWHILSVYVNTGKSYYCTIKCVKITLIVSLFVSITEK